MKIAFFPIVTLLVLAACDDPSPKPIIGDRVDGVIEILPSTSYSTREIRFARVADTEPDCRLVKSVYTIDGEELYPIVCTMVVDGEMLIGTTIMK